jgi:hypothetical protein
MRDSLSRSWLGGLVLSIVALAAPGVAWAADYCDPEPPPEVLTYFEEHLGARRESEMVTVPGDGEAPEISFIDSPSATCFQPDPNEDVCWVNWYYTSVDGGSNYMICMYTMLNAVGKVTRTQGFFQTSMYIPYNMYEKGFRVPCGALGSGGEPNLGAAYAYTIRARDSAGLSSANYGTVYCPAYTP